MTATANTFGLLADYARWEGYSSALRWAATGATAGMIRRELELAEERAAAVAELIEADLEAGGLR